MTSLMKLRVNDIEKRLDDADLGLGHMHIIFKDNSLSHCDPMLLQPERCRNTTLHGKFMFLWWHDSLISD